MKRIQMLSLLLSLIVPSLASAQTSRATSAQAEKNWEQFYAAFRAAVDKRDSNALKQMMANRFESNGGGQFTPAKWLRGMNSSNWKQLQRSVALGTKRFDNENGRPGRITKDEAADCPIFSFGKDQRWRWVAVLGD
ncbi:MAG: hypothetical protein AABO41_07360 [Acidobacteriota bacterium]